MGINLATGRLAAYGWHGLRRDLIAGLTVAAVALPQAMAYALIAGVDPKIGLYTAVVMTAVAAVFGSSSHLINGPTNAISLVVFSAIAGLGLHGDDSAHALQAVFLLSLLVGGCQIIIALLRLGDLTRYVSESVILGFMAGAGLLVALGQVPNLLGIPQRGDGHDLLIVRLWLTLTAGNAVSWASVALGAGTALVVIGLRRLENRLKILLPDMLIGVVLAALIAWQLGLTDPGKGMDVPPGSFPAFAPPVVYDLNWIPRLSGSALAIALLGLLEALAVAKSIASRTRERLDYNRQCLAEGLANLAGGLFQCMPGSGSLTRSAVNYQAGAVSRWSGIIAAAAVAAALLAFAGLARFVPKAALAGLLMVIAWRLVDWKRLGYCLRATRFDAGVCLITAGAAVFISIEYSILIGTFFSFLFFVPRAARLQASELIVSPERVVREKQPGDAECGRLVLLSLEGELFFGAAPELDEYFAELKRRVEQGARVVILRLKRTRNPDMVCLEKLQTFLEDMAARKATVLLCGVRADFARALHNLGFHHWLPSEQVFLEETAVMSSTLQAVRRAYELLGDDLCPTCPRRGETPAEKADWYYMI